MHVVESASSTISVQACLYMQPSMRTHAFQWEVRRHAVLFASLLFTRMHVLLSTTCLDFVSGQ